MVLIVIVVVISVTTATSNFLASTIAITIFDFYWKVYHCYDQYMTICMITIRSIAVTMFSIWSV